VLKFKKRFILCLLLLLFLLLPMLSMSAAEPPYNGTEWSILLQTNKYRMASGKKPLSMIHQLQTAARTRARELTVLFSHTRPDGTDPETAVIEAGLYEGALENIGMGHANAAAVVKAWSESPLHNASMLGGSYHIGTGCAKSDTSRPCYVQLFLGWGCSTTSMRLILPDKPLTAHSATSIESLGIKVVAACAVHGDSYMPLISEMCGPYDFSQAGQHIVKVYFDGFEAEFVVNPGTKVEKIQLVPTTITLTASQPSAMITSTVLPETAENRSLTWTSSDISVARVDEYGLVVAGTDTGTATITAHAQDESMVTASCEVVVESLAERLTVYPEQVTMVLNQADVTIYPQKIPMEFSNPPIRFTSSDERVAIVDDRGIVKAIGNGQATITAQTTEGTPLSATTKVTVITPTVIFDPYVLHMAVGAPAKQLQVKIMPETAPQEVVWTSAKPHIASVDENGLVTPLAEGQTEIFARNQDGTGSFCNVFVSPMLTEITLSHYELEYSLGARGGSFMSVQPVSTQPRKFTYVSDNESVAKVDSNGSLTTYSLGEANITISRRMGAA
jgi:uncharacterized protein YjdB